MRSRCSVCHPRSGRATSQKPQDYHVDRGGGSPKIGASILDPHGAAAGDEPPAVKTSWKWTDAELKELGNMLLGGLSIEEIAHRLPRDKVEVRDKVAEVGRAYSGLSSGE